MKKLTALLLLLSLLLCGCGPSGQHLKDPVTFYYLLDKYEHDYKYGEEPVVFAPEEREASGHRNDLNYLLALYLIGPSEEGLRSPVPWGTRVLELEESGKHITLKLSDTTSSMSDIDFTRACACLTLTCLDLTDADKVTVQSGDRSVTMTRDTLILFDDSTTVEETT